jgi:hypothetical protein
VPPAASGDFCADGGVTVVFFLNASLSCSWVSDWKLSIRPAFFVTSNKDKTTGSRGHCRVGSRRLPVGMQAGMGCRHSASHSKSIRRGFQRWNAAGS